VVDRMVVAFVGSASIQSRRLQQFAHGRDVIRDASLHRRGHAKSLVNAPKVIPAIPEHDSGTMVAKRFGECRGETREALRAKSERKVGAFHMRGTNQFGIGHSTTWDHLRAHDFGGAVSAFAFGSRAINFHQLREVYSVSERGENRGAVRREAIRGDLKSSVDRLRLTFDKNTGGSRVAVTNRNVNDQLGDRVKRDVGPGIAPCRIMLGTLAALLASHEPPHLVGLYLGYPKISDLCSHHAFGFFASKLKDFEDGFW